MAGDVQKKGCEAVKGRGDQLYPEPTVVSSGHIARCCCMWGKRPLVQ